MTNSSASGNTSQGVPQNALEVLDGGFVRLELVHGDDLMVVNAARVSFGKRSRWSKQGTPEEPHARVLEDKDARLISYLAKNGHWTPFGHPQISLHMRMPIFVARQFMRSNVGIVYNEESRRYVSTEPSYHFPAGWRCKPEGSIKQGSGPQPLPPNLQGEAFEMYLEAVQKCIDTYNELIKMGVAPEQARMVLPLSTYTELWATMSLAACARICKLRMDPHAQKEIRDYANAISSLVQPYFPVSWPALLS